MRLPLLSSLHRLLEPSHEVARSNARAMLEVLVRQRREREEVDSFLHRIELERRIAQ